MGLVIGGHSFMVCPSKLLFHIPCPGCGMSRATDLLLHGRIVDAAMMNANSFLFWPVVIIILILSAVDVVTDNILAYRFFDRLNDFLSRIPVMICFIVFEILVLTVNIIRDC